jgi:hypothetical protein
VISINGQLGRVRWDSPRAIILSTLLAESFLIGLMGGLLGCGAAFLALHLFSLRLVT